MSLADSLKGLVSAAGGPVGALLNPHSMKAIGANIGLAIAELPPSPVVIGAISGLIGRAIVDEMKRRPPSERFMEVCRETKRFDNDAEIIGLRNLMLGEI